MAKDFILLRCPECGEWCVAKRESNFLGRMIRSIKMGDEKLGEAGGIVGDSYDMEGAGKTLGRVVNLINIYKHGGEMLNGKKYRVACERCGKEFGTDDDSRDMIDQHELWQKAVNLSKQFKSIKDSSEQDKQKFTRDVQETLAEIENSYEINDAKAILYDTLACCYFYFFNDSKKALLEINQSLDLYDDEKSHVLKGLFIGKTTSPVDNYAKMNELLKIHECESDIMYIDKTTIFEELEHAESDYERNFISIPENQRKFLVVTSDYTYLPNSFKVLRYNDVGQSDIVFENGIPNNNAIYVCHPYKPNIYYPSESYQTSLFKNQLNEFREILQCLGAKSIRTENSLSSKRNYNVSGDINGNVGSEYKGIGANVSAESKTSNSAMESMVQKMLIDDEFSFNPDLAPFVPEGLIWYEHMEEWQRLTRMRLRGQNKYSISISSQQTHIVNENEANAVNADFKALVAKGNLEIAQTTELKASEENTHEWRLIVEFYPLSEYDKQKPIEIPQVQSALPQKSNYTPIAESRKNNYVLYILIAAIVILLVVIGIMLI